MKRFSGVLAGILAVSLLLGPVAAADRKPYVFDPAHSQINFTAEALLLTAQGYFATFDAEVQLDAEKLENSTLTLTIDAASINTRVEARDRHLRSAAFFDVANFPKITFVATKITKVDDQNLSVAGDITIRGITKPILVPIRIVFFKDGRGRFKGAFAINRKDFNVSYNSNMNPIEDVVQVQFDLNLRDKEMMEQQRQRMQQQQQQQPPAQKPPTQ